MGMTDTCHPAHAAPTRHKYFELLAALYQAKDVGGRSILLESVDQRLLEFITVQNFLNRPLSMMQLLNSRDVLFLGASTISRKIDALGHAGWIRSEVDVADRRMKFILPTEKTLAYFAQLNALMPA